jgi:hypothetical protein
MSALVSIPSWNNEGLLPAVDVTAPTSANRAPYAVSLSDFVMRFSTSAERIEILKGFLKYRAALHSVGLLAGFQWVNGSFVEHVEICPRRRRSPSDVDVVTFYEMPVGATQSSLFDSMPELFPATPAESDVLKKRFLVDGYLFSLANNGEKLVTQSAYWYGVWSHQRETLKWKGFLQLDLAPMDDNNAAGLLSVNTNESTS